MLKRLRIATLRTLRATTLTLAPRTVIAGDPGAGKSTALVALALFAELLRVWQAGEAPRGAPITRQALLATGLGSFRELWTETGRWHRRRAPIELAATFRDETEIGVALHVDTTEQAWIRVPRGTARLARTVPAPRTEYMGAAGPALLEEPVYTVPARAHLAARGHTANVARNMLNAATAAPGRWPRLADAIESACGWRPAPPRMDGPHLAVVCTPHDGAPREFHDIGVAAQHAAMALATVANAAGGLALLDTPDAHMTEEAANALATAISVLAAHDDTQVVTTVTPRTADAWPWLATQLGS